jgi:hypothetical protein
VLSATKLHRIRPAKTLLASWLSDEALGGCAGSAPHCWKGSSPDSPTTLPFRSKARTLTRKMRTYCGQFLAINCNQRGNASTWRAAVEAHSLTYKRPHKLRVRARFRLHTTSLLPTRSQHCGARYVTVFEQDRYTGPDHWGLR